MKRISETGKVSFVQAVKDFYRGYFDFRGRSTRRGYWWVAIGIIAMTTFSYQENGYGYGYQPSINPFVVFISVVFVLSLIIPMMSLLVRRLRDTGIKSKAILALYVIYYALYGSFMMGTYPAMMRSLIFYATAIESTTGTHGNDLGNSALSLMANNSMGGSSILLFLFMLASAFLTICTFLPTDMLATKSKHPVLTALFYSKD